MAMYATAEIFDGLMLSDGSVTRRGRTGFGYSQFSKHKEFLDWCAKYVLGTVAYGPYFRFDKRTNKRYTYSCLQSTRAIPEFTAQRLRWYKHDKKIIPRDLIITPNLLLAEYLGDGCLTYRRNVRGTKAQWGIKLSLDSYAESDVRWFVGGLLEFVDCNFSNSRIYIPTSQVPIFLRTIGLSPVRCYDYKWNYDGELHLT